MQVTLKTRCSPGLSNSLRNVDVSKNSTVTQSNYKLQVAKTHADNYTTFSWMYTNNDVDAPEKTVAIGYQNGELKYFIDSWSIYNIGSTDVKLSEKDAVAVAMQSAKDFSYQVGLGSDAFTVSGFNVTCPKDIQLQFCDDAGSSNPRGNGTALYPMWRIGVGLDHWYPGNVYGIYVNIWADTGKVKDVAEVASSLPSEYVGNSLFDNSTATWQGNQVSSQIQLNSLFPFWFGVTGLVFGVFAVTLAGLFVKRKFVLRLPNYRSRRRFPRFTAGLICILMFSVVFVSFSSSFVHADKNALIFGDLHFGDNSTKPYMEQQFQQMLSVGLQKILSAGGYYAHNLEGTNTSPFLIKLTVFLTDLNTGGNIVVYFDHGIGSFGTGTPTDPSTGDTPGIWHYSVYADDGTPVFDKDIYEKTRGNINFAFISTCMSAAISSGPSYGSDFQGVDSNGYAVGMPFAWTHRIVESKYMSNFSTATCMTTDGYGDHDNGNHCYMGFPMGSPMLNSTVDQNYPQCTRQYGDWVYAFFWCAMQQSYSINSALDEATLMLYNSAFGSSALHTNFISFWGESKRRSIFP